MEKSEQRVAKVIFSYLAIFEEKQARNLGWVGKEKRIVQVKKEDDPVIMATYIALSTFVHMKFKITIMGYFLIPNWSGGKNSEELVSF